MTPGDENERRFVAIVEPHRRRLHAIACSFARGADRDDLLQEILLQVWRSLPSFDGRSSYGTWIYRVGLNTALTYRRRRARHDRHAADVPFGEIEQVAGEPGGRDAAHVLEEFASSLGDLDRALLALYLEDTSYRDMAEITGLSESHVGVRLARLKKRFTITYIGG